MISFVTDILAPGESCLLDGVTHADMTIRALSGECIATFAAPSPGGWTHAEALRVNELIHQEPRMREALRVNGADAYIGEQWVGGTEV